LELNKKERQARDDLKKDWKTLERTHSRICPSILMDDVSLEISLLPEAHPKKVGGLLGGGKVPSPRSRLGQNLQGERTWHPLGTLAAA